ncbi:synaptic vesicle glycoprotein 2B-like [Toxorhynchites rutilus septentrionalis]|uniref:synaptic vesicle glycoprotein 2B-like n=1 Tax=Toxorhynchites rutilus septentrionalis TaxID=329112 RepID=UPI002479837E|nr:synaptic vesicle glycoprotein 2B-like [Toxorhynchites rutilus septentrionalis]
MENSKPDEPDKRTAIHCDGVTLDEALSLIRFGKFNYLLIAIAGMIHTAVLMETIGISFVIAVAECDLRMSTQQKGILGAIAYVGIIVSSHLWGFLADTRGRRKVIVPTLFLASTITLVSSFMSSFWAITVCRFLTGFFISGASATVYPYLGEFHSNKTRSRAILGASFVYGFGCLLLPTLPFLVMNQPWDLPIPLLGIVYRPWRLFLAICGLPGFVSAVALLKFPESPKFVFSRGNTEHAIDIIHQIQCMNSNNKEQIPRLNGIIDDLEIQQSKIHLAEMNNSNGFHALMKLVWKQTAPLFMEPYMGRTVIMCFLQFGMFLTAHGMYVFFPGILNQMLEAQEAGVNRTTTCDLIMSRGYSTRGDTAHQQGCSQTLNITTYELTFILEAIHTVGFAVIGLIINTVGKLLIMEIVFVCCGISGIMVIFVDIPLLAIWLYMILMMGGLSACVTNTITVDLFPTNLRAMAVSISLMFGRLGSVTGANMLGLLLDSQCQLTFGIAGSLMLVCGVIAFFIPNIHKKVNASE